MLNRNVDETGDSRNALRAGWVRHGAMARAGGGTTARRSCARPRAQPIADPLQSLGVTAGAEPVVERLVGDPGLVAVALGPLVPFR
jgi:hypothetical protein